jgi:hypothetical protein
MPLPARFDFVDKDRNIVSADVRTGRPSGYEATPEYHPTMVVVRCAGCRNVGVAEFVNGFNLADGDKLMQKRTTPGFCMHCRAEVELVPIPNLSESDSKQYKALYDIQRTLEHLAKSGQRMQSNALIWPLARLREYQRWLEEAERERSEADPA